MKHLRTFICLQFCFCFFNILVSASTASALFCPEQNQTKSPSIQDSDSPYIIFPHAYSYTIPTAFTKREKLSCFGQLTVGIKTVDTMRGAQGHSHYLGAEIFGEQISLKDVYLASALAAKNLLTLPGNASFGGTASEQYLATLANTQLKFFAQEKQTKISYDMAINYPLPYLDGNLYGTAGAHICLAKIKHYLQLNSAGGKIGVGNIPGENNITQFFNSNNIDFINFFNRTVLEPKGLRLEQFQQHRGISSWSLFGEINYLATKPYHPSATCGINVIFPAGTCPDKHLLWPIKFGKDSKIVTEFFAEIIGTSESEDLMFSPFAYCSCAIFSSARKQYRVPMLKNNHDTLFLPESFKLYTVEQFEEWDSSVPQFADQCKTISIGPSVRFIGTIGNNFKNIFDSPFSLYAAYRFLAKSKPSVTIVNDQGKKFMSESLEHSMCCKQHSLFFNISFYQGARLQAAIGSQITCGGENTKNFTKLFVTLFCMF